ncbi:DUF4440 domain-containing protein [Herbaspirillum rhizosphaerae]|uniref:nuclear transport factor 2 family protein n=1 Tax=Herbaspirillum rhizosphaerae TaxID=346179 RepID=UPI00067DB25C|nr:DUF4440 domain-containing protein [Herbaspirillum rhizosphaerae]
MTPERKTDQRLLSIQEQLMAREPLFHRPDFGATRDAFEAMMADEFWETGASGRRYSKQFILDTLAERHAGQGAEAHGDSWETSDFYCQEIAPDHFLLTYTLSQGVRITRRTSLWRRQGAGWVIVYHQGTPAQG